MTRFRTPRASFGPPEEAAAAPTRERALAKFARLLGRVLEGFIVLLALAWVFILGVMVGRSRPEESGHRLVLWLEKAAGWGAPRPAFISGDPETRPPQFSPGEPRAAPAAFAEPEAIPEALPEAAEEPLQIGPLFSVQVLTARGDREAQRQVDWLTAHGFTAYFSPEGPLFPVRVGPFPTRAEAEEHGRRLETLGYQDPYVLEKR